MSTATHARQAERQLERDYDRLKPETLASLSAKLRARGLRVADADLDGYYNQAWHALYQQAAAGTEIDNPGGFLVLVGFRRAIDDLRTVRDAVPVDVDHVAAYDSDLAGHLDDQRMLREFTEALREELGERERVAATLCYLHGYTRPEAAGLMGLNERRMQKVMDAVSKAIGRITRQIQAGERCDARASQNKAYALGLLDPDGERYLLTRAHLDDCATLPVRRAGLAWAGEHLAAPVASLGRPRRRGRRRRGGHAELLLELELEYEYERGHERAWWRRWRWPGWSRSPRSRSR